MNSMIAAGIGNMPLRGHEKMRDHDEHYPTSKFALETFPEPGVETENDDDAPKI